MAFQNASAKNNTVAFGSITSSYTDVITAAEGTVVEVKNSTTVNLSLKFKNTANQDVEIILLAGDVFSRIYPLVHQGVIQVKHLGTTPTSGSLFVQSIAEGS